MNSPNLLDWVIIYIKLKSIYTGIDLAGVPLDYLNDYFHCFMTFLYVVDFLICKIFYQTKEILKKLKMASNIYTEREKERDGGIEKEIVKESFIS